MEMQVFINNLGKYNEGEVPANLQNYFDYEAFGVI
ncbi:hypothetical protein N784_13145 [Pontibacillus litoralis JSM 072002]|uniref:Uncharacterized protein n=1 Tax=Pontibacillus litoralis JSM 072002 TaxID=1385512 RepID=A0A0A5FXS4_9BACI|nr:hypothetical protein N784_13145 [Pontibacillus litoralis JSM 072002]